MNLSVVLNKKIGKIKSYQHYSNKAIDINMENHNSRITNVQIFNCIKDNLVFNQLIWKYGNNTSYFCVHMSYNVGGVQRKQVLKATKGTFGTKYTTT